MPRYQRIISQTGIYHVMVRGNERKNLFLNEDDKQRFVETLFIVKTETGFFIFAYCLMDNHIHLLIKESSEGLATIMKRINTSYAYYFNKKYHRVGHLFQDRFKSEPIEDERYLLAVIRYIHNNPVKAGLVTTPGQYQWSSYNHYLKSNSNREHMADTEFVLSMLADDTKNAIEEFKAFSLGADDGIYMDIEEGKTWTLEDGRSYLKDYLNDRWPGQNLEALLKDKNMRVELIVDLKTSTGLSIRAIAELLGINRGIVQKTKS